MKKKKNDKHERRIKKLIVGSFFCAIVLAVSTYAWFIGMKTVNVSSFDDTIAATDSLSLSLDGEEWADTISIDKATYSESAYEGNKNAWPKNGLVPVSTVGKIDKTSSRLTMFEKGSLTATPGGYRLMASQVKNNGENEQDGYVAFDLFIRNLSGNEYYKDFDALNEEAIYLTPESKVTVAEDGAVEGEENSGIENSVRVAFAEIGRVVATTNTPETITGINCSSTGDVTTICEKRDAQIWEPNDTKHVKNAINWYTTSCKARTGDDVTKDASYGATCTEIKDGTAYPTYAVSGVVNYSDNVDVYDGTEYNTYTKSVSDSAAAGKLVKYDTFTDTMKDLKGVDRPTFITLAPNSITKVRVYIYIEGQDIDNYDFASLGKKIKVGFGFTKERFYGEDVEYDGTPALPSGLQSRTPASS